VNYSFDNFIYDLMCALNNARMSVTVTELIMTVIKGLFKFY